MSNIMNRNRFIIGLALVAVSSATQVFAQRPAAKPTPPSTVPQTTTSIPTATIAVIYSQAFADPKTGIARFGAGLNKVNGEFLQIQKDLDDMKVKIQQLQAEITKAQNAGGTVLVNIKAKVDQLDQLKKDYQRKGEDAQAAYAKRRDEILGPLNQDIGKALDAYAKAHGIAVIIDGSQVPLVYAAESIDVTSKFINEFNSKNSATASVAPRQ
jgi:Skp family chaperone for outer membrane proteins